MLSVQYQKIWDGCCLDEKWGEEQIFLVFRGGLGIDTQKGAQKSINDLYKSQEGDSDGQVSYIILSKENVSHEHFAWMNF